MRYLKEKDVTRKDKFDGSPLVCFHDSIKKIIRNMFSNHFSLSTLTNNNCSVDVLYIYNLVVYISRIDSLKKGYTRIKSYEKVTFEISTEFKWLR